MEQRISKRGLKLVRILKLRLAWQVAEGTILKLSNLGSYCQGITPSNSKGGLPAPEAGAHAEEGGIRDEIDPSPSRSRGSRDKAETQSNQVNSVPGWSREEPTRRPALRRKQKGGGNP